MRWVTPERVVVGPNQEQMVKAQGTNSDLNSKVKAKQWVAARVSDTALLVVEIANQKLWL